MTLEEIETLIKAKHYPEANKSIEEKLHETHISFVILTDKYAFKIKKPLKFSFLDFSTLEKRKFYCEQELHLNRRLAEAMYLKVLPVTRAGPEATPEIGGDHGQVVDYALMMKKMDNALEMDKMLAKGAVTKYHMDKIAQKISPFHQKCDIVDQPFDIDHHKKKFNDIKEELPFIREHAGDDFSAIIADNMAKSDQFLESNAAFMKERNNRGMIRNGHGDLHSHNIFLYDDPVIFDCIEFNDQYRHVDLLSEIAFFCMDLEFYEAHDLSNYFYETYTKMMPLMDPNDEQSYRLFTYYKSYRANVRAKVTAINAREQKEEQPDKDISNKIEAIKKYLRLMAQYWEKIN